MQLAIRSVLPPSELGRVQDALAGAEFADGQITAGPIARQVKNNLQSAPDIAIEALREEVCALILATPLFVMAARPKAIVGAMFSRYDPGHAYGRHVDNAIMSGRRADVSFTLFLSDPATYEGGELVIETTAGEDSIKLEAGDLFVYPSTFLHSVAPLRSGSRLAMVGWVRSYVCDAARREILFDLETVERQLFERLGKTGDVDLISKTRSNLLRAWAED
ncbi:MAG: Fe2+-dependent dioxygenase [Hyphomicrobiaceae bacterium]|nr:MAG: Fe2+-dependent dioxygenase [Hyphomicrobiaceae bacterium]